ncbi:MBL fold metallo-hydrolase [Nocardia neocaledoniensis]|uniref:MBL fold metallo-hydrolase n=1 Tax=Nocardia neocaledoniensis TaxID=236511 RepID=UPI002453CFE2|nr:MBL fold metallo-hydrolase [Nocardia neocaledoniensis]
MPPVVEQPAHWTEAGAHPVAPGVYRIPLPLPLDGLTAVNAYLIEAGPGLILIDPGWASRQTEMAISSALRSLGHQLNDVTLCLATHHHWDHYTQAYAWRFTLGSRVLIGEHERHSIEDFGEDSSRFPNHAPLLLRCGAADLAKRLVTRTPPSHEIGVPFGVPDGWLKHGDRVELSAGHALEVMATPGHTRGHVAFYHRGLGLLFSGDHVLPAITPSIGFELVPESQPLRSFLASLRLVRELPDAVLLPSHGPVTASAHVRIDDLFDHHRQRLTRVADEVAGGADTAYAVARMLPWTRRAVRFDDLPLDHQLSAITEIDAHLDVLAFLGRVTHQDAGLVRSYTVAQ